MRNIFNFPRSKRASAMLVSAAALSMLVAGSAQAVLQGQLGAPGDLDPFNANGGINPVTGNAWANGDTYRLAFVTSGTRNATSPDIADYHAFVQNAASAVGLGGATWRNIGQSFNNPVRDDNANLTGVGVPIFLLDGVTKLADDNNDLKNGPDVFFSRTETGTTFIGPVATGSSRKFGDPGQPNIEHGRSDRTDGAWWQQFNGAQTSQWHFYGISDVLTLTDPDAPPPSTLTLGDRNLVSVNNANFNISVFDGKARYDNAGTSDPLVTTILGDGTVEDYNFIVSRNGVTDPLSYASGGAGLTPNPYDPNPGSGGFSNNNGQDWANVWTTSDPDIATKDFISGSINTTHAGHGEVQGTVDISGFESGTLYFPHGTFINQWELELVMTGLGVPTLTVSDAQTSNGVGTNFGWITDFSFTNPGLLYDTITYTYTNADLDGSRARFMGVILDGVAPTAVVVPEPATASLALLAVGGLMMRRRRAEAGR